MTKMDRLKKTLRRAPCCCCCKPEIIEDAARREVPQQDGHSQSTVSRRVSSGLSDPEKVPPYRHSLSSFFPLRRWSRYSKRDSWSTTTSQFEHPAVRPLSSVLRPRTPGQRPPLYSQGSWSTESLTIEDEKLAKFFERTPLSERVEPTVIPNKPMSPEHELRAGLLLLAEGTPLRTHGTEMAGFEPEEKAQRKWAVLHENLKTDIHCVCRSRPLSGCSISAYRESVYYPQPIVRAEIAIGLI
ncbi:unnamed protein product [Clonostachys chloroleuca]|uniref:Uncharacterized protein n=1 Tax=Clonostachys chloroleuca TaxID=1926264 RepID=A0AA35MAS5_9HYPO|nr:unnamed protein product [Clonostachys chloroleuca]